MEWLTVDSVIKCGHRGTVVNVPSQEWVRVVRPGGPRPVLVDDDPQGRTIRGCPNSGPNIKKCGRTLKVTAGYSTWLRVDGAAVVLSHLDGLTDGSPPGAVHYRVTDPRQDFLRGDR